MGIVLAISPIAGQLYGAQHFEACGAQLHQAMWLALALSVPGCLVLLFPQPFLDLARAQPEVAVKVRGHLAALAVALPPALLFTAFRGFNTAVSRPKAVMALQLGGLAVVAFGGFPLALCLEDQAELVMAGGDSIGFAQAVEGGECVLIALDGFRKVFFSQGKEAQLGGDDCLAAGVADFCVHV